ncbi:alpha-amylase family protein [Lutibaculum baratangense]|uniref:Trehalose synthase n=1 Tax=Lutibaculum baratangense AMV1 TaxID=631454 RepID=V4RAL6_9HYPH|nr:alpha-amylase family protein [Lutibaculum baratangense]ESR22419.1 Trehalose synthase [Lutibaculum baratangense AMV1]
MLDLWYKNAVIYCLDVETFMDGNGDGCGDFRGLADRLDHIERLGATCIWLLPFYPTPNRDNGYDITDFYGVDPRLGTLGDFVAFTRAAADRGLRVLVDLVINHTSTDHPWFQSARSDPNSPYRDWYVWSKEKPENIHEGVIFPGVQDAIWDYDRKAKAWYLHRFYDHQADLNIANPEVREEIDKIMGFWLQLGVSGFRLDAVPFVIEYLGLENPPDRAPEDYLSDIRRFMSWRKAESVLLAEANVSMKEITDYFGVEGNRMHMVFNFMLNQYMFLAFVRHDAEPIRRIMDIMPDLPVEGQWGSFLRNHDELDLGRLSSHERQEVYDAMAPDPGMIVYDRGIRRRLAPMLANDQRRLKLAYALMFALPGTPVLWYGEEIGMAEDLSLDERDSVRTPLQWSERPNGGFSDANPEDLVRPVLTAGPGAFDKVNVRAQAEDQDSLMNFIRRLITARRSAPEIGWGQWSVIEIDSRVLGLRVSWRGNEMLTFHNFASEAVEIEIPASPDSEDVCYAHHLEAANSAGNGLRPGDRLELGPYGFAWLRPDRERR